MDLSAATDRSSDDYVPRTPSVADYWPDSHALPRPSEPIPHHAADTAPALQPATDGPVDAPATHPTVDDPAPPSTRPRLTLGGVVALALLLVAGGVLGTFIKQAESGPRTPTAAAPATTPQQAGSPVPTGPVPVAPAPTATSAQPLRPARPPANAAPGPGPKTPAAATFEMASSAGSVTVRSQDVGADFYRFAPADAKVTVTGPNHRLTLAKGAKPAAPVTVTLDTGVRWALKLSAGNTATAVNLTGSKLASVELAGGADEFDLALPRATGTLPLRVTHGMNKLTIKTNGVPVRVTLRVGAGKVIIDGDTRRDTKPGKVITSDGWAGATDRVDLDAVEGVGTLTVDTGRSDQVSD